MIAHPLYTRVNHSLQMVTRRYFAISRRDHNKIFNESNVNRVKTHRSETNDKILFTAADYAQLGITNKYFQGIRLNTAYIKNNNTDSRDKANNFRGRKITDLPFQGTESNLSQKQVVMTETARFLFEKFPQERLHAKIRQVLSGFFTDLIEGSNTVKIQPNFERQARRVISSLKHSGLQISHKPKQEWNMFIQEVEIFKGLEVTRNNNYSTDSYEVISDDGYTFYKLFQNSQEKLPEVEWFSQKNMLMRIKVQAESPCEVKISQSGHVVYDSNKKVHQFVIETDLRHPPEFSGFSLNPADYVRAYRPSLSQLVITNVDNRNPYAAFTFNQNQKKDELINKLT